MIKFIIIFVLIFMWVIYPLFIYWNDKLENKYFAELYQGIPGTGKTGLCTKEIVMNQRKKTYDRVYCNFELPGSYLFNIDDIRYHKYKFKPNSLVLIDEAGVNLSNREFKKLDKDFIDWFAFLRHNKCRVKLYSQSTDIDKKVRDKCQKYHIMSRWFVFTVDKTYYKTLKPQTNLEGIGEVVESLESGGIFEMRLHYLPRYVGLWDTYDYIKVPLIPSRYIMPTPKYKVSMFYKKWYRKNMMQVYSAFISRVSAMRARLYERFYYNTIFIDRLKFKYIRSFGFTDY